MAGAVQKLTVRGHAVRVLAGVIDEGRSLNALLERHQQQLPPEQHSFLSILCYGSLRWYLVLEFWLQQLLSKPLKEKDRDIQCVLIIGLFQLAYLDKPKHAVINETVNLSRELKKPWSSKLINGVLRNFIRRQEELEQMAAGDKLCSSAMPSWLFDLIKQAYPQQYMPVLACLNERAPMTLRVNPQCYQPGEYLEKLESRGISARQSALARQALVLSQPCDVDKLPGFFQGACSVQDEAAQLVTKWLNPEPGQHILDACCAPGGKTAALLEAFPEIKVTAVDADANRQQRTHATLERLSLNARVITGDAGKPDSWWDGRLFDHILLDAPCSASGVIRRHPDIKHLRRAGDIAKLSQLQGSLLTSLWSTLKPEGTLLYATCSVLPQENTEVINHFLTRQADAKVLSLATEGDVDVEVGCQFLPETQGHDGFYYCLLAKKLN